MHDLIRADAAALAALADRNRGRCAILPNRPLPPGAAPPRARIGVEGNPDGSVRLLVDRGIVYTGGSPSVRRWLANGGQVFPNVPALHVWLRDELAPCYAGEIQASTLGSEAPSFPRAEDLTDLVAVRAALLPRRHVGVDAETLHDSLTAQVRGQDAALSLLTGRIAAHTARVAPRRPATVLAVGPTGVGKTRTAEALAEALRALSPDDAPFGYLRLDMNEYRERHRVSQLLGAPQGYVGYGDGAQLVDTLAARPRTLVLFDEIEKAHPHIFTTLMNAMDAGRLSTAAAGDGRREVDCRRAIFYFTTNLDARGILAEMGEHAVWGDAAATEAICRRRVQASGLAPELVGRIGTFLAFAPLSEEARAAIVALAIARLGEEYGLRVAAVEPTAVAHLLMATPESAYGARPDEYRVADVFGEMFAASAAGGLATVRIAGPPLTCLPA